MTDIPEVRWLLDCEPRPAQIEALLRSYHGYRYKENKDDEGFLRPLPWAGSPATGFGHFMEMRVGKTPTALNEYMLFKRDHGVNKGMFFSPNKYKYTWGKEATKFGVDVPVHIFESRKRKDAVQFMKDCKGEGIIVANYEALIYPDNNKVFADWIDDKTYMPADESVMIKNNNSSFFTNILHLSKTAAVTRPMTGLPSPQSVCDLWSQLRFARKLNGVNFYAFRGRFANMGGFRNRKVIGMKNEEELHALLDRTSFKARRIDWGTKIESDYERVKLEMTPAQKVAYKQMDDDFIMWLDSGEIVSADQVITKRMKMQQIASGFIIDEYRVPNVIMPMKKTPKCIDLIDRLENYIDSKVLVIAHYKHTINELLEVLAPYNPAIISGNVTMSKLKRDAEEEKNRFNNDPKCRVMIGQSQAIKYGHTLMGTQTDPCLSICFFENNYSLDNRSQTEERPQGEGQLAALHIWDYFSCPIEREIVTALQTKKDVAASIMAAYRSGMTA